MAADASEFYGNRILVTVPVGVLKSGSLRFMPGIPAKTAAARKLGFGPVIKVALSFENKFWSDKQLTQGNKLADLSFLFSSEPVPTWWTRYPEDSPMLTGWLGGPNAAAFENDTETVILQKSMESLGRIFNISPDELLQKLIGFHVSNWLNDPHCLGGYSYEVVNGSHLQNIVKEPVKNTLFFAGEGLYHGPEIGTVESALHPGREMAHIMISTS
jgi:monoamine oxidase